jgi:arylformamidase
MCLGFSKQIRHGRSNVVQDKKPVLFDVSVGVSPTLVTWPGDPKPTLTFVKRIAEGGSSNLSEICMGSHTGTHVDAPLHFDDGGATIDRVPLDTLVGPARVVDMRGRGVIHKEDLVKAGISGAVRVLVKTDNSALWSDPAFHEVFSYLAADAAKYLVENAVLLVGVDYLSVEKPHSKDHLTHHAFLDSGVVIIEGLNLAAVPPGDYDLMCMPLKVVGAEAAPARVVLRGPA